jgi:hypothetical protein
MEENNYWQSVPENKPFAHNVLAFVVLVFDRDLSTLRQTQKGRVLTAYS